jgi:hypothetical protein
MVSGRFVCADASNTSQWRHNYPSVLSRTFPMILLGVTGSECQLRLFDFYAESAEGAPTERLVQGR